MGCFTVNCILCGGPPYGNNDYKTKWLNKCVFLSSDNLVYFNVMETACGDTFELISRKPLNVKLNITYNHEKKINNKMGVFCHMDCYKYFTKKTGIKLNYMCLPDNHIDLNDGYLRNFNYESSKYWDQFFNFEQLKEDKKMEIMYSPLYYKKSANNLNKIISFLKVKKKRIGPQTSASFYKGKVYKIGNDGNIWKLKNNKWIKENNEIKFKYVNYSYNLTKKYKRIGESSNKPIFYYNSVSKNKTIFIGYDEFIKKIK